MGRKKPPKPTPKPQAPTLSVEEALNRAYAHWNAGQSPQAELLCQRVLAVWPGQSGALHLLGLMAHAFGNHELAIQHLRQACTAPRAPALYFSNLAEMCRRNGLLEEAETAARRATSLEPGLVGAWNNLGIILQEAGKFEESVFCLERVAALEPGSPETHNNLGNTLFRMGRLDGAKLQYDRALSLYPHYAEAHSNLAHLLHDLGQYDEAAAAAQRAIDLNPQLGDAYLNRAEVELTRQNHAEALRWLDALLYFAPRHAAGLVARAKALKQLGRADEALAAAQAAIAAAPLSAGAHNALGEIHKDLGRLDEALAEFDRAETLPGTERDTARLNRGVLLMEAGRMDEARAVFDQLVKTNPRDASVWASRAELKKFAAGDPDIARMEALLGAEGGIRFDDRMTLHFSLGKAYLDHGDSARAFLHLGEGNRMKRSTIAFDAAANTRWMKSIAKSFPAAIFKKFTGVGDPSAMPVFVIGIPRSGTTLIEQILASHPRIHGAGELRVFQQLVDGLGSWPEAASRLVPSDLNRLGAAYIDRVRPLAAGRSHVVDKMPANFLHAGMIRLALPNALIIHCRRDPVDTCLSCYTKLFAAQQMFAYDLAELGTFHRGYQALMAHWRKVLPKHRFIEVDYEAVIDDLEGQARRLIDAVGLPWDNSCLRFHENKRQVQTASLHQVRQPIYRSSAGRWKSHAAHLGPLLAALGIDGR